LGYGVNKPYTVPKNCYFVVGDNINFSADSRYFGPIQKEDIVGKAVKVYWPLSKVRILN